MRTTQLSPNRLGEFGVFALMVKALALRPPESGPRKRRDLHADVSRTEEPVRRRGPFERLDHWLRAWQQRDDGAYPARASNVYDLSARTRAPERNASYPYY